MKKIFIFILVVLVTVSCSVDYLKTDSIVRYKGVWVSENINYEMVAENSIPKYVIEISNGDSLIFNVTKQNNL